MIDLAAYALALALSQEPETAEPAPADPAVAAPAPAPTGAPRPKGVDEVTRALSKVSALSAEDRQVVLEGLMRQYGGGDTNLVMPTQDIDLNKYIGLPPQQQVEVVARGFFTDLIGGESNRLVLRAGYPFFIEARRIDKPEDLQTAWAKMLRSRRTDLLKLYGIEVLTAAEMEKKYGKAPARLSAWSPKSGTTYFAVGNLSGHAAVLLLRQAGAAWQVVGFHD